MRGPDFVALCVALLSTACFLQNASPQVRASDAVMEVNDHSRWGRAHAALGRVTPAYQARFLQRRSEWGKDVQVADVEIQSMRLIDDDDQALAVVDVSWYLLRDMQLQHTFIRQKWIRNGDSFLLASEAIIDGDKSIFVSKSHSH
ncbi:MAG: hypothetical protein H6715_00340 [Myxococcales bacterium]|nr:hypothetical protein [Myxococcales bacterium]MCB9707413.1 hypothetical protein [Myxococcales bacterium]